MIQPDYSIFEVLYVFFRRMSCLNLLLLFTRAYTSIILVIIVKYVAW